VVIANRDDVSVCSACVMQANIICLRDDLSQRIFKFGDVRSRAEQ
jgi:hypothetical protein